MSGNRSYNEKIMIRRMSSLVGKLVIATLGA